MQRLRHLHSSILSSGSSLSLSPSDFTSSSAAKEPQIVKLMSRFWSILPFCSSKQVKHLMVQEVKHESFLLFFVSDHKTTEYIWVFRAGRTFDVSIFLICHCSLLFCGPNESSINQEDQYFLKRNAEQYRKIKIHVTFSFSFESFYSTL